MHATSLHFLAKHFRTSKLPASKHAVSESCTAPGLHFWILLSCLRTYAGNLATRNKRMRTVRPTKSGNIKPGLIISSSKWRLKLLQPSRLLKRLRPRQILQARCLSMLRETTRLPGTSAITQPKALAATCMFEDMSGKTELTYILTHAVILIRGSEKIIPYRRPAVGTPTSARRLSGT
jgi:hypothetical protein